MKGEKCRLMHVGGEGRKFEKGAIFTMVINLTSMQGIQVGKFDLRPAINNTAETRFNYSERCVSPPRITDYFIVDHFWMTNWLSFTVVTSAV